MKINKVEPDDDTNDNLDDQDDDVRGQMNIYCQECP